MKSLIIAIALAAAATAASAEIVATSKLKDGGEILLSNNSCPFGGMDRMLAVKWDPKLKVVARGCWSRSGSAVIIDWVEGQYIYSLPREMSEREFINHY